MIKELEQLSGIHPSYFRYLESPKEREPRINDSTTELTNSMRAGLYGLERRRLYLTTFALHCGFALAIILGLQSGQILTLPHPVEAPKFESIDNKLAPVQAQLRDVSKILSVLVPAVMDAPSTKRENEIPNEVSKASDPNSTIKGKVIAVSAEKALLRGAPSTDANVVTEVQQGVDLLVLGQKGDWYQVFSPKGERLWADTNSVSTPKEFIR